MPTLQVNQAHQGAPTDALFTTNEAEKSRFAEIRLKGTVERLKY